jgi:hypothetical protein
MLALRAADKQVFAEQARETSGQMWFTERDADRIGRMRGGVQP